MVILITSPDLAVYLTGITPVTQLRRDIQRRNDALQSIPTPTKRELGVTPPFAQHIGDQQH